MTEVVGVVLELGKCIATPILKCLKYHMGVNENMGILKQKLEELNCRKRDLESKLDMELVSGVTMSKNEVRHWLERVDKINSEIKIIEEKVEKVKFFYRASLGKDVMKKIEEVEELHRSGEFPNGLVISIPKHGEVLPTTTTLGGETTFKRNMEEIWTCLMNDEDIKIGVHGMGGIGKTTALEHINKRILLEGRNRFDNVIWVTVSKDSNVRNLQDKIAHKLNLNFSEHDDETTRATKLYAGLNMKKRYVLILDDLWQVYSLKDVGIPEPTLQNGCKLVLTTRSLRVCNGMSCKVFEMKLLSENEALNLFLDIVGPNALSDHPNLEVTMKQVVRECAGLPLAVVTVAGSLKGIVSPDEWEIALEELRESTKDSTFGEVFDRLMFSYDRLGDKRHQDCLLYCALYPEDYNIERNFLIEHLIVEGIIEERKSRKSQIRKGHVMLNKLVNVCLLIDANILDVYGSKYVKMHDLIRDMALRITSESPRYFVNAGVGLKSINANEEIWKDDVCKISLMNNPISDIPSSTEPPKCSSLSTLLLNDCFLSDISDNFFLHMKALRVLDLSNNVNLKKLPESVSDLVSLTALFLRGCYSLTYVPSLVKLKDLNTLDLSNTTVEEVPQGVETLVKLRYLNLFAPFVGLKMLPDGTLRKLTNLRYLSLNCQSEAAKVKADELENLGKLETFHGILYDFNNFNAFVRSLESRSLTSYVLQLGFIHDFGVHREGIKAVYLKNYNFTESAEFQPLMLPKDVEELLFEGCIISASNLCEIMSFKNVTNLKACLLEIDYFFGTPLVPQVGLIKIEHVFSYSSDVFAILQSVERLDLGALPKLRGLIRRERSRPLRPGTFSSLRVFVLVSCPIIKKLFVNIASLPNLEFLDLRRCSQLKEFISTCDDDDDDDDDDDETETDHHAMINIVTLPKLRSISLWALPKLQGIPVVSEYSLEKIFITDCPKLKRLPLLDREPCPPSLRSVHIDNELWESLEWDHPNAKDVVHSLMINER